LGAHRWVLVSIFAPTMPKLTITKDFSFEAAHALEGYDGPCRNIHGHSYKLSVTVGGVPVTDPASPKKGMIMDFSDLKKIVKEHIIDPLDHALILPENSTLPIASQAGESFSKILVVGYQPTSENLLSDFATRLRPLLPEGVRLERMRLRETATSCAEWQADQ
jgi:6-pyruvoyltetrahydropterin/6-carboxytetrahydropterin synthase